MKHYKVISRAVDLIFLAIMLSIFLYYWIAGTVVLLLYVITTGGILPGYFIDELHELHEEREIKKPSIPKESPFKKHIGQVGIATSALRPHGEITIDGMGLEALSLHPYVVTHSQVKVVDADMRCVIVEKTS